MGGELSDELIPEGLRDIYRKIHTSSDQVDDERVKSALIAVLGAIHKDVAGEETRHSDGSNVVEFARPESPTQKRGLAKSR